MWHTEYFKTKAEAEAFVEKVERERGNANRPKYSDGRWTVGYTYD